MQREVTTPLPHLVNVDKISFSQFVAVDVGHAVLVKPLDNDLLSLAMDVEIAFAMLGQKL